MSKKLALGVFEIMNPSNGVPTWKHPQSRADRYDDPKYWIELATMLDAAGFDFLFFADGYGYPTIDGEVPEEVLSHGIRFPGYDPMLIISALAQAAPTLSYVVTSSTTLERPYAVARRFASLDRYTDGRIGWNVVTGSAPETAAGLFGLKSLEHDKRYDVGDEFVDLCRGLWEDVWDDDALVANKDVDLLIDPAKIRPLAFQGEHFSSHGLFTVPPTRQRTPVLFQAGMSGRGRDFGARNAEALFIQGQTAEQAGRAVADIRRRAVEHGRQPDDVKIISGVTVTVAATHDEAVAKRKELEDQFTRNDAAVLFAGFTGIDLRVLDPELRIDEIAGTGQGHTPLDRYKDVPGIDTVGDVLDAFRVQERGFTITGDPQEVAQELVRIAEISDIDGYMLEPTFGDTGAYADFIEFVLPELQAMGVWEEPDRSLTLRERLRLSGPRTNYRPAD